MPEAAAPAAHRGAALGGTTAEQVAAWEHALDALELHLDEIRGGLEAGALPEPYEVCVPDLPVPEVLVARARRLLAAQEDVEGEIRGRMGNLARIISGTFEAVPAPIYLDRRN